MPFTETTILKKVVKSATITVTDYRWQAGDHYVWSGSEHLVTWRVFPAIVDYSAVSTRGNHAYGRVSVFPADLSIPTSTVRQTQRGRSVTCRFEPDWFRDVAHADLVLDPSSFGRLLNIDADDISYLLRKIGAEMLEPKRGGDALIDSLCTCLAIELARHINSSQRSRVRTRNSVLFEGDLQEIVAFLEANIDKSETCLTTACLCREFGVSATQLRRSFKSSTGHSLQKFVADLRLEKAKSLLAGPDPIKTIAFRLGFRGPSSFSYAFRAKTGMTAREYRAALRA